MNIPAIGAQQPNAMAFKARLLTEDVIQVGTKHLLPWGPGRGIKTLYDVCEVMTGRRVEKEELVGVAEQCHAALVENFPILKTTILENARRFFDGTNRTLEEMMNWKCEQIRLFGSDVVDVPEITLDEAAVSAARERHRGQSRIA